MTISYQQARHFRDIGYIKIPDAIEQGLIAKLDECVEGHYRSLESSSTGPTLQEKTYHLYEKNPELMSSLVTHHNVVGNLVGLLGPNIVYITNRHNQAAMNLPGRADTRLHRDVLQWSRNVVTVVVYLEDSDESNGCTRIIPGSHCLPLVGVPQLDGGGTWMDQHLEFSDMLDQSVPVPMNRGSLLIFDGLLFHATGLNLSESSRKSIVLGYRSVDELDRTPDPSRQILVAGKYIYRGNDRPC